MPISKVKKERWCDGERRTQKGKGMEQGEGREKRAFVLHPHGRLWTLYT